ncbi:hypothetical protein ACQ4PT_061467 [Festuca glaucescens]
MTKARWLDSGESTSVAIAVDGRARMSPGVPDGYTGNVVLWARPTATAGDLVTRPVKHAVELINREVARINDGYFKSFIDFASSGAVEKERLVATADAAEMVLSPNIEVDSWLRIPFYDMDFGGGRPFFFMPATCRWRACSSCCRPSWATGAWTPTCRSSAATWTPSRTAATPSISSASLAPTYHAYLMPDSRSCWAFAVVATVESLHQIKTGKLLSLSEQQLVDCGTFGCNTGLSTSGFTWIKKNKGITTEADYPYTGKKGTCDTGKLKHSAVTVRNYGASRSSEQKLLEAVVQQPVTVAIEASADFQSYKGGVFSGPCGFTINHIVTVVGYGKDAATGKKYWIVKNSYGQSWGMGGYILMERGIADPRGMCDINFYPVWPTM